MKQGDALSCAIFIICIDPLLRNLNADLEIKVIELETPISKDKINFKLDAFADDVGALCRGDFNSIQNVFTQYERLTRKSRLVLKAEKTEILVLNSTRENTYTVTYIDRVPYFH